MARAFWSGSLSFGLVEIPVRLHRASEPDDIDLMMLDQKDLSPIGYQRINKTTGRVVPWERIVRGYELQNGKTVVLTPEDFQRANVKATRTIDIVAFVDKAEIEPLYYETPYYVEPSNKASKSYLLLRDSLERTEKVGIANVVLHTRQHLAALLVSGPLLVLDLLRFQHEIRKPIEIKATGKGVKTTAAEARLADKLIDEMTGPWRPGEFHDEYRDDLLALIRKKARAGAKEIEEPEPVPRKKRTAEVVDLMPLLKQSLEGRAAKAPRKRASSARAAPRRRPAARRTSARRSKAAS